MNIIGNKTRKNTSNHCLNPLEYRALIKTQNFHRYTLTLTRFTHAHIDRWLRKREKTTKDYHCACVLPNLLVVCCVIVLKLIRCEERASTWFLFRFTLELISWIFLPRRPDYSSQDFISFRKFLTNNLLYWFLVLASFFLGFPTSKYSPPWEPHFPILLSLINDSFLILGPIMDAKLSLLLLLGAVAAASAEFCYSDVVGACSPTGIISFHVLPRLIRQLCSIFSSIHYRLRKYEMYILPSVFLSVITKSYQLIKSVKFCSNCFPSSSGLGLGLSTARRIKIPFLTLSTQIDREKEFKRGEKVNFNS